MNFGVKITNLYAILNVFSDGKIVCRHDIYHRSGLAVSTINRCLDICIRGKFIQGARCNNYDLRRQNFELTKDGYEMLRLLKGAV